MSVLLFVYNIIKHDSIFPFFFSTKRLFNNDKIFALFPDSKDSIPPIIKQALYSHKRALYKNAVNSSFEVSLVQNKIFCETGKFLVRYLYIRKRSLSIFSLLSI